MNLLVCILKFLYNKRIHLTKSNCNNSRILKWMWILRGKYELNIFINVHGQHWSADQGYQPKTYKKKTVSLLTRPTSYIKDGSCPVSGVQV